MTEPISSPVGHLRRRGAARRALGRGEPFCVKVEVIGIPAWGNAPEPVEGHRESMRRPRDGDYDPDMSRAEDAAHRAELEAKAVRAEAAQAQELIDAFVARAKAKGITPVPLRATLYTGQTVKTDKVGWYLRKNETLGDRRRRRVLHPHRARRAEGAVTRRAPGAVPAADVRRQGRQGRRHRRPEGLPGPHSGRALTAPTG